MKLDSFDRKILAELQRSSKLTNVELASRVGLSPSPCLARVKALEAAGVIKDYVALLDSEKLGGTISVFIHVTLERQSEQVLDIFEKTVSRLPEVMECYLMSGDADYLLRVVVRDTNGLRDFVLDKLTRTQGVANIRSSFALKQVKYNTSLPIRELWPNTDSQK
jgi:DNA-binding Lrp family transcriptional regulator